MIWVHQQELITEKKIKILGKEPTQGLEHTLSAEKLYRINFTKKNTKFCLNLDYNGTNSYLFVNDTEIIKFNAKDSKISAYLLYLGNISKDCSQGNMKRTGFNGYIYDVDTDYNAIAVSDISDFHKYLMKNDKIVKMFGFIKQIFISTLTCFGNLSSVNSLECVSIKNQECKVRPEIFNINSNNPIFYPFSIRVNKCNAIVIISMICMQ